MFRGLPALIVAGLAVLLAAYGKYVLPPRLIPRYSQQLAEFQRQYAEGVQDPGRLIELGSSIDICYSRLESLGAAPDAWERLEFMESYIADLRSTLSGDRQEDLRKQIESQIVKFTDMQERLIAKLAAPESPFGRQANLRLAERVLAGSYDTNRAESVLVSLQQLLDATPNDRELRWRMGELLYERAWWQSQRLGNLPPPADQLTAVAECLNPDRDMLDSESPSLATEPRALRLWLELLAMRDAAAAVSLSQSLLEQITSQRSLNEHLQTAVVAQAILGKWSELRSLLAQKFALANADEQNDLRKQVSKSVARLLFSQLPDHQASWRGESWRALQLSMELNPSTFEIFALLWELALQHAEYPSSTSPQFVEAILISESDQKYLILAISNALRDQANKAAQYLELGRKRDAATLTRLSNIVLWRSSLAETASSPAAPIMKLKPVLLEVLNEQDSVGWIALARLQLLAGENAEARDSLMVARPTFEDSEVIDSMLKVVEERLEAGELGLPSGSAVQ